MPELPARSNQSDSKDIFAQLEGSVTPRTQSRFELAEVAADQPFAPYDQQAFAGSNLGAEPH